MAGADLGFEEGCAGYAFGTASEAPWRLAVGGYKEGGVLVENFYQIGV